MSPAMPIAESVAVTYYFFAAAACSAVSILASSTPGAEDAWASVGAMLAGGITVVHAMRTKRSMADLTCVLISAVFSGSVLPGVVVNLQFPEFASRLTWHAWSGAGFVGGLAGWSMTRGMIAFFESIKWDKWLKRKTEINETDEPD